MAKVDLFRVLGKSKAYKAITLRFGLFLEETTFA
jgi:hypothetical protein